jgi:rubrerythrin
MESNFESAAVEEVTGMGFSVEWAEHALSQSSGDPAAALDFIFDHTDEMDDLIAAVPRSGAPTGPPVGEVAAIIADDSSGSMHVSDYSGAASHAAVVLGIAVSDAPALDFLGEDEGYAAPPAAAVLSASSSEERFHTPRSSQNTDATPADDLSLDLWALLQTQPELSLLQALPPPLPLRPPQPPGMAPPSVPHSPPPLAREKRARAWACAQCTFEFGNDGALVCPVCLAPRHGAVRTDSERAAVAAACLRAARQAWQATVVSSADGHSERSEGSQTDTPNADASSRQQNTDAASAAAEAAADAAEAAAVATELPVVHAGEWVCKACTFVNPAPLGADSSSGSSGAGGGACAMCGAGRGATFSAAQAAEALAAEAAGGYGAALEPEDAALARQRDAEDRAMAEQLAEPRVAHFVKAWVAGCWIIQ